VVTGKGKGWINQNGKATSGFTKSCHNVSKKKREGQWKTGAQTSSEEAALGEILFVG